MIWNRKKIGAIVLLLISTIAAISYAYLPSVQREMHKVVRYVEAFSTDYLPVDKMDVKYVRQLVTTDNSTSRTIMWESTLGKDKAILEYRIKGQEVYVSKEVQSRVFIDDSTERHLYSYTLTGLIPDTMYEYRIGYGDKRSEWYSLKTAKADRNVSATVNASSAANSNTNINANTSANTNFKTIIFPDSQSADYTSWTKLVKTAYEANTDTDLYISMGDLVDNGEQASQWDAWFRAVEPLASSTPLAAIMGNHETYNLQWKVREPISYLNLFDFPNSQIKNYTDQFYSFNYNGVHFVVLDTQFAEETNQPELLQDELAWLRNDLANNTSQWTIVLMHKDTLRYGNTKRPDMQPGIHDMGRTFMPIFDEFKVDVVLSAHYHTYRRRGHIQNFARSEVGPYYIITGVAGDVRYPNLWKEHPLDVFVAPQPESDNYIVMTKSDDILLFQTFYGDGRLLDSFELKKSW